MNNITAKDLMVGDWMQHFSGNYFRVTRIDKWGDGSTHFACGHPHLWDYNNKFSPIPLTAEILVKIGFVKQWNNNWQLNDYHSIIISENFYIAIFELSIRLDYVHELQRALRLCSINKEITL